MICSQCNKEFTPTHGRQKYCSEECIKSKATDYRTKYRQTDKGKEAVKKYNQSNKKKEYEKSDKYKAYQKIYLKKYKQTDKGKADRIKYFQSDKAKAYQKKYRKEYAKTHQLSDKARAYQNSYQKKRIKYDPIFKLIVNARTRLNIVLKNKNIKKMNSTIELFGCTPKFLKEYLEKQFYPHPITNEKMTWQNHTLHGWHVDHIDPLDLAMIPEDVVVLAHYTNLQPMWATENIKKGNKIF